MDTYTVEYEFDGSRWVFFIRASSRKEVEMRLEAIAASANVCGTAEIDEDTPET